MMELSLRSRGKKPRAFGGVKSAGQARNSQDKEFIVYSL